MTETDGAQNPFAAWLEDRTKPVPPWADGSGQIWLNAEPGDMVSAWCWPCTTGPDAWIARIPDPGHNPDYDQQVTRAVREHIQAEHAEQGASDA